MKTGLLAGVLGACLAVVPLSAADDHPKPKAQARTQDSDMRRAIEFEHHKDEAAARQARIEAKHPTDFNNAADRSANPPDSTTSGRKVSPKVPRQRH